MLIVVVRAIDLNYRAARVVVVRRRLARASRGWSGGAGGCRTPRCIRTPLIAARAARANSGKTIRYRLHRGGDRQLNRAIHIIALGRVAWDPDTRAYIHRQQAEGKTKLEAIRCLKRHLARRIWRLLYTTTPARNPTTETLGDRRRSPHNGLHGLDLIPNQANSRPTTASTNPNNATNPVAVDAPALMPCTR